MSRAYTLLANYIIEDYMISIKEKIELLKECVEVGVDINKNNSYMLFSAINKCAPLEIIKFLIDNGIDIHAENDKVLYLACMQDKYRHKFEVVKLLLEFGAKITTRIIHALTIYSEQYFLAETDIKIIKLLISYGADPFEKTNQLFCRACYSGNVDFVQYLLDLGANCNISEVGSQEPGSFHYNTFVTAPISFAFEKIRGDSSDSGKLGVIKLLLDHGANPNEIITTNIHNGFTVIDAKYKVSLLEYTIINCDFDGCKLLFEYGADINFCYNIINKNYVCFRCAYLMLTNISIMDKIIDLFMEYKLDIKEAIDTMIHW